MGVHKRSYLTSQQIEALQLMVDCPEMSRQDIADKVGCARSTIYEWLSDEKFKDELIKYSDRLVVDTRVESLKRIKDLMKQDDDKRTAFASAKFLCELNGLTPTIKVDQKTTETFVITYSNDDEETEENE